VSLRIQGLRALTGDLSRLACLRIAWDERAREKGRKRKGAENERVCVRVRGEEAISLVVGVTYLRLVVCEASHRSNRCKIPTSVKYWHMLQKNAIISSVGACETRGTFNDKCGSLSIFDNKKKKEKEKRLKFLHSALYPRNVLWKSLEHSLIDAVLYRNQSRRERWSTQSYLWTSCNNVG